MSSKDRRTGAAIEIDTHGFIQKNTLPLMSADSNSICRSELGPVLHLPRDCQARLTTQGTAPVLFERAACVSDGKHFLPIRVGVCRPLI